MRSLSNKSTLHVCESHNHGVDFTSGLKGLDGQFSQQVFDARGKQKENSTGRVALSAPRLFRWEYVKPYPQLIVADGDHIWIYDPDMEQVTVRQQSLEEQNSPLAMLIDIGQMERQFKVTEGGQGQGLAWLELMPRKPDEAPFDRARLYLRRLYKRASRNRFYDAEQKYGSYVGLQESLADRNIYSNDILRAYSKDELQEAGRMIEPERDTLFAYNGLYLLATRYLATDTSRYYLVVTVAALMTAAALNRDRFFGKDAFTTVLIMPIALPGIVTGIALLVAGVIGGVRVKAETS